MTNPKRPRPLYLLSVLVGVLAVALWLWQPWAPDRRHFFTGVLGDVEAAPEGVATVSPAAGGFEVKTVVKDLSLPWDLAFLPSETEALVTEKAGAMWRVDLSTGNKQPVTGMPSVRVQGQGGLHAVVLHPQFAENGWIYLSYAAPPPDNGGKGATTHFMRARLSGTQLSEQKVLLVAKAPTGAGQHFGGAMAFDRDGYLFVSVGDRGTREDAQKLTSHNGKILRLHDDGRVPKDNPFVDTPDGALPEIWSYGHRNPQGLSFDPTTGVLWEAEHGPQGGDELNRIERGRNYGWPVITYGREYGTGFKIGEGTTRNDVPPPVHHYIPSIATAGIAYYAGDVFPQWKHSVFVAALRGHLNRVQLTPEGRFVKEERLLTDAGLRVRSVRVSPKGEIYVVADDGVVVRVARKG